MLKRGFWLNTVFVIILACLVITGIAVGEAWAKEKKTVVMLRWRYRDKTDDAFVRVLNTSQYEIIVQDYEADQNKDKLVEIIKSLDPSKIDLIYATSSTVSSILLETTEKYVPKLKEIPVVFNLNSYPIEGGIIKSWEHSGNNFTGVSHAVPVDALFKILKKIVNFKRLGMIFNPKETNCIAQRDEAKALENTFNFTLITANFTTKDDLESAMSTFDKEKVDAVWLPTSLATIANQETLLKPINERKLPTVAAQLDLARRKNENAALVALGADFVKCGELAGRKGLEILAGKKPNDIPSEKLGKYDLVVNLQTARKIDKKIPVNVLEMASEIVE